MIIIYCYRFGVDADQLPDPGTRWDDFMFEISLLNDREGYIWNPESRFVGLSLLIICMNVYIILFLHIYKYCRYLLVDMFTSCPKIILWIDLYLIYTMWPIIILFNFHLIKMYFLSFVPK